MKRQLTRRIVSIILIIAILIPAQAYAFPTGNATWEKIKAELYEAAKSGVASTDIKKYGISTNDIQDLVQDVYDSFPDLFYADLSSYSYVGSTVYSVYFTYNEYNTPAAKAAYEEAVENALSYVNNRMSDIQKALALHNYLVRSIVYEEKEDNDIIHSAYAALVDKRAVCDGYVKAYMSLLARCGIDSYLVRSAEMDHVWTHVKLDDKWYNIDITWDDPTPDRGDSVSYSYFMLSDEAIKRKGHHDWDYYCECTDKTYDTALNWASVSAALPTQSDIFTDIFAGDYYYKPVLWAYDNGITKGTSKTEFGPAESCTRAQAVTFLWRSLGCPEPNKTDNPFTDIKENQYYYKAVLWAVEYGITNGTSSTTFSPDDACKSEHIISFVYRSKGKPMAFSTGKYLGKYYDFPYAWAEANGFFEYTHKDFNPDAYSPRADIVTYLYLSR